MTVTSENSALKTGQLAVISETLVQARLAAIALPGFPGELPANLTECYDVQDNSRAVWGETVAGWKVGGMPGHLRAVLGADWLTGPIFSKSVVHADGDRLTEMPAYPGFAAVEAEFVFMLGETEADDRVFIGVEIASSPIPAINDVGPKAVVCDFGNNCGVLIGPEITDWRNRDWPEFAVTSTVDGELLGTRELSGMADTALAALAFIRGHARQRGIALPAGTFISSGALTGVHEAKLGSHSVLDFGPFGQLQVKLIPASPRI